ncbi:MAG: hypothetical protein FJ279_38955 [Planctomycetes bacterium]|nr:hypothetical protein [Planctomycetota bacterium]
MRRIWTVCAGCLVIGLWAVVAFGQQATEQAGARPRIVSTEPKIGASDVDPGLKEISITFDQDMAESYSWTGGGELYPKTTGKPTWKGKRTCALPVQLEPGQFYRVGINAGQKFSGFRSAQGVPTATWAIWFTTQGASAELVAKLQQPKIVSSVPQIGDQAVDANLSEIRVTFDQEMGGGFSLTGSGPSHPTGTGQTRWDETKRTLIWPVKLEPNHEYRFGVNSFSFKNFSSAYGVPVSPVLFQFKTRP